MKLGQGNIFRSMCQEFCPRGRGGGHDIRSMSGRYAYYWNAFLFFTYFYRVGWGDWSPPPGSDTGKVMFSQVSVSLSIHNRPHGYSVTAHPRWLLDHCSFMLRCGRYASYWNTFLLNLIMLKPMRQKLPVV